jgi:hypothetical protein
MTHKRTVDRIRALRRSSKQHTHTNKHIEQSHETKSNHIDRSHQCLVRVELRCCGGGHRQRRRLSSSSSSSRSSCIATTNNNTTEVDSVEVRVLPNRTTITTTQNSHTINKTTNKQYRHSNAHPFFEIDANVVEFLLQRFHVQRILVDDM